MHNFFCKNFFLTVNKNLKTFALLTHQKVVPKYYCSFIKLRQWRRQWSDEFLPPQMPRASGSANIVPQVYPACQVYKSAVDCASLSSYNLFFNTKKQKHKQQKKFSVESHGVFAL
jgi:hypothetical protein